MSDEAPASTLQIADAASGARLVLPLAASSLAYGVVFGALAAAQGLTFAQATTMSATLFAGSAQLVVLEVWAHPPSVVLVTLTALAVNVRLVLYGATLAPTLGRLPTVPRYATAFFLVDETFALAAADQRHGRSRPSLLVGAGLVLWVAWVGGTVAGHLAGGHVADPAAWGLDFVFVAVFVGLLTTLGEGRRDVLPWVVAGAVALVVERLAPGAWYVVAGGLAGSVAGAAQTPVPGSSPAS